VGPLVISGWAIQVGEVRPLPREIVMMEECWAVAHYGGHLVSRSHVEGQGEQVLDDHQIGAGQGVAYFAPRWRRGGVNAQSGEKNVHRTRAGHGGDAVSEEPQGRYPFGRLDGDTVVATKTKTNDGN